MDLNAFLTAYDALKDAQTSDEPATKKEARKLAAALKDGIEDLLDWASETETLLSDAIDKADELADADTEDRPDCHSEFAAAAEAVVDSLVDIGVHLDTVETLRATAANNVSR